MPILTPAEVMGPRSKRDTSAEYEIQLTANPELRRVGLLFYASWVDRKGDPSYARALRYVADNNVYPGVFEDTASIGELPVYAWGLLLLDPYPSYMPHLQPRVFNRISDLLPAPPLSSMWDYIYARPENLTFKNTYWVAFRSPRLAFEYLARAIDGLEGEI